MGEIMSKPYFEYWKLNKVVPDNVCDLVISIGNWEKGQIGSGNSAVQDNKVRQSDVVWLHDSFWISTFLRIIHEVNAQSFEFDLTGIEPLQVTRYKAPKGHYSFHQDGDGFNTREGDLNPRKLSMSVLLSDKFEGGVFQYQLGEDPVDVTMKKGDAVFFPSYYLHRVTPVTKGTRHSLVAWANGPKLK